MCVSGALAIRIPISPGRLEAYRLFHAAARTSSDGYAGDRHGGNGGGRVFIAHGHPNIEATIDAAVKQAYESRCQDKGWADDIPGKECVALLALYDSTGGDDWINRTGWLSSASPCEWRGIKCERGHVTSLGLHNNQLTGTIPPELGNLSALTKLWLNGNQLTGTIPPGLSNLGALVSLWLGGNKLTGSIPLELGNLGALKVLDLHHNQLTGTIPPELGNLGALEVLLLHDNQLTGTIPPPLKRLCNTVPKCKSGQTIT